MGGCVSSPRVGGGDHLKPRRRSKRRIMVRRMRIWSRKSSYMDPIREAEGSIDGDGRRNYANPIFRGMVYFEMIALFAPIFWVPDH